MNNVSFAAGLSSAVSSDADMGHLSVATVNAYLNWLAKRDIPCLSIALFFLSVGMKFSRDFSLNTLSLPKNLTYPVSVDENVPRIRYGIINGAYDFLGDEDHFSEDATMELSIPTRIHQTLRYLVQQDEWNETLARIDRHAREFDELHPGGTPTISRLSRTQQYVFPSKILNEIECQTLHGRIKAELGASGDYVNLDIAHINQQYRNVFMDWLSHVPANEALRTYLNTLVFEDELPSGNVGSQIRLIDDDYQHLSTAIRSRFENLNHRLCLSLPNEKLSIFIDVLNLQHVMLYFLQCICLAIRPIGEKKSYALTHHHGLCSREKNSRLFIETSYTPIIPTLMAQLVACADALQHASPKLGLYPTFLPAVNPTSLSVARVFTIDKKTGQVTHKRMRHENYKVLLCHHGLEHHNVLQEKDNAHRHWLSSTLRADLPHSVIEELLSHKTNAHDYLGDWSTGTFCALQQLEAVLENKIQKLGITVLNVGEKS